MRGACEMRTKFFLKTLTGRRPRFTCDVNIKIDLAKVRLECENWINLAQNRNHWMTLKNTVMKLRVPKKGWRIS